jgi:peroxidase
VVSIQGCDASILIDPLSNQASEKEAGPNISVKGYDIIDEIKTELEKKCPEVVSCADILAVSARDAVKMTGGPAYKVPTGRRDSLVSNREDADNLPGPDIPVPKLLGDFSKKGFDIEETVALLAGGHTIGSCKCFFIETDAAPIDPDYKKNISTACDGANRDKGSVPLDMITPDVFDGNYFGLALAKKMPLTVDRLMGIDPGTEPVLKTLSADSESFVPIFAKAMEKISVLQVITGKDGEIRKSCGEFNNPQASSGEASVIRVSSISPDQMLGTSGPGAARSKVVNGGEAATIATPGAEVKKEAGVEASKVVPEMKPVVGNEAAANKVVPEVKPVVGNEAAANKQVPEINPVVGNEAAAANKVPTAGEEVKGAVATEASNKATTTEPIKATGGNKVLGDEPASKLPAGAGEEAAKTMTRDDEFRKRNLAKLQMLQDAAAKKAAGGTGEAANVEAKKLRGGGPH